MSDSSDSELLPDAAAEPRPVPRRRRSRSRTKSRSRSRLSVFYFTLAAAWGFVIGSASIVGALAFVGEPVRFRPALSILFIGAAAMALAGGWVVARAYGDASGRFE